MTIGMFIKAEKQEVSNKIFFNSISYAIEKISFWEQQHLLCKITKVKQGSQLRISKKLTKSPRGVTLNISLNRLERKQGYGKQIHADLYLFPSVSCSIDIFLIKSAAISRRKYVSLSLPSFCMLSSKRDIQLGKEGGRAVVIECVGMVTRRPFFSTTLT